jgi:hypothetical protein
MPLVVVSGGYNRVDRGADNPTSYIMKPVKEGKARSRVVVPQKKKKKYIVKKGKKGGKMIPLHAMEGLWVRGGAPTHS